MTYIYTLPHPLSQIGLGGEQATANQNAIPQGAGPNDPWEPGAQVTDPEGVDEEDDVYEPEDYAGDYPLESDIGDDEE